MIERHDFKKQSAIVEPEVEATILKVGGTNPYGEPMFRLCLAEDRIGWSAGEFNIWDENLSVEDRGGLGIEQAQNMLAAGASEQEITEFLDARLNARPLRVEEGMRRVPCYPNITGWILEKWRPCSVAPSEWNAYTYKGEPALGPYPQFGEYELIAGPTPYRITSSQAEQAIRQNFKAVDEMPRSPRQRIIALMNRAEEEQKAKDKKVSALAEDMVKDGPLSLRNRLSLGAGRVMNEHFERIGDRSHHGA